MPELPEIECLSQSIATLVTGKKLIEATFLRLNLRFAVPIDRFRQVLLNQPVEAVTRRSKYLIMQTSRGSGLFHLGMSGNLFQRDRATPQLAHTHAVFTFCDDAEEPTFLHYVDPRRFGIIEAYEGQDVCEHPMLSHLGPEPLTHPSLGDHLWTVGKHSKRPIKTFIMDAAIVVGVGNIYASEALFLAKISPTLSAHELTRPRYQLLGDAIQETLSKAIADGGTSFRDFLHADGSQGGHKTQLAVYGRAGEPCLRSHRVCKILHLKLGGRATYYCPVCQKR